MAANFSNILSTVIALQQHFMTSCIFFIQFDVEQSLQQISHLVQLEKHAAKNRTCIMTPKYSKFITESRKEVHPLNVILPYFMKTEAYLRKFHCEYTEHWLLFLDSDYVLNDYFSDINIPFNCEFLVAQQSGNIIHFTELYRVAPHLPLKVSDFGIWNPDDGSAHFITGSFELRRQQMDGLVLNAHTIDFPPFTTVNKRNSRTIVEGVFGEVWSQIERLGNFTCNVTALPTAVFGMLMKNGSWNGMVGMLERGETDVVIASFTMTAARTSVVSYTLPILHTKYCLLIGQPEAGVNFISFLLPFSGKLWIAVSGSILLFSIILTVFYHIGNLYHFETDQKLSFVDNLFVIFGAYCLKGGIISPQSWPCRLIQMSVYIAAITLLAAYSAALISYLATQEEHLPFNSFEELLKDGSYKVGVRDSTAEFSNLKDGKNTVLHEMYVKLLKPDPKNIVSDYIPGIQRMCQMRYALWGPIEPTLDQVKKMSDVCKIILIPGCCTRSTMAIPMRKDNPYLFAIRHLMMPLMYNGVLNKMRELVTPRIEKSAEDKKPLQVDLKNVVPLIIILLIGIITSVGLLVAERNQAQNQCQHCSKCHKTTYIN